MRSGRLYATSSMTTYGNILLSEANYLWSEKVIERQRRQRRHIDLKFSEGERGNTLLQFTLTSFRLTDCRP